MAKNEMRRSRRDPQQRRKQLISIGLEMLTLRPLHQITVDEVAAQAGISRSLLFHYFPTKRDYYAEVVRAASRRLLREASSSAAAGDGRAAVEQLVDGYLSFIERRHEPYLALLHSTGAEDWVREVFVETRARLVDQLLDALGIAEPSDLVSAAVGSWLSFAEDLALEWARHHVGSRASVLAVLIGSLHEIVRIAHRS